MLKLKMVREMTTTLMMHGGYQVTSIDKLSIHHTNLNHHHLLFLTFQFRSCKRRNEMSMKNSMLVRQFSSDYNKFSKNKTLPAFKITKLIVRNVLNSKSREFSRLRINRTIECRIFKLFCHWHSLIVKNKISLHVLKHHHHTGDKVLKLLAHRYVYTGKRPSLEPRGIFIVPYLI